MEKVKIIETGTEKGFSVFKSGIGVSQLAKSAVLSTFGFIGIPYVGMNAVRDRTGSESVITGIIQKAMDGLKEGESVMFSKTSEGVKATIYARVDGSLEINGDDDYAVRYSVLKAQFDELNNKFNTFVEVYNIHVHPVPLSQAIFPASTPSSSPTPMSGTASTADMSEAKVDSVKLPKT